MSFNYTSLIAENNINSTAANLKQVLHKALGKLEVFEECALLDYPDHPNIGDNLIWLGEVFYLTGVLKTKINYAASENNFSETEMEKQIGKAPILLHGGGNLGDLWSNFQEFRQHIISKYQNQQHRLIITNRLHGHILCILMNIPHIFLPNAYYKNEKFYETWTYSIPFCRFVKEPSQIKAAAQELLDLFRN